MVRSFYAKSIFPKCKCDILLRIEMSSAAGKNCQFPFIAKNGIKEKLKSLKKSGGLMNYKHRGGKVCV